MPSDLNHALKQFEAVQANIAKLERLWDDLETMLPTGRGIGINGDPVEYRRLARSYRHIAAQMPAIDGFRLNAEIMDPDDIMTSGIDLAEVGELQDTYTFLRSLVKPGDCLAEYKHRAEMKRRELARDTVRQFADAVLQLLATLKQKSKDWDNNKSVAEQGEWAELRTQVKSIGILLGETARGIPRWDFLSRHLHFGLKSDLNDIVELDWPAVRAGIEKKLYGPTDALPVDVSDLGELVASKPRGAVATELNWESLTPELFERLLFNLVDRTPGYEKPEWLTHTNAPDRGRDVSVERVSRDGLVAPRRERVIVACKKQKSVGLEEVAKLKEQMSLWEPPRVDELIIATTGRFTTDAVQWIEKHNQSNSALHIEMWPESHIERLLAERPELIAEFALR